MVSQSDTYEGVRILRNPKISISHYSEGSFLDRFRQDLAQCTNHVTILSPFLSQNRAVHYYPVLHSLTLRKVIIDVYTRPKGEQPETLQDQFDSVKRTLNRIGIHFHHRPGMHEKIAVIDDKILWHGSLNILSYNDTRESMLRFDFPDLVQEIMNDLGLSYKQHSGDEIYLKAADPPVSDSTGWSPEVQSCPKCKGQMHLFENGPECSCALPISASPPIQTRDEKKMEYTSNRLNLPCPLCESPIEIKHGVFVAATCTSKDCGFSLDHRLSASLYRILKRRE
ncbi:MAG: hypothetical protein JRJ77_09465 [Deltaproteobacteria bacterium]|nr:hypothetical protein [Deltaproteobacteria bacterium]